LRANTGYAPDGAEKANLKPVEGIAGTVFEKMNWYVLRLVLMITNSD
jgi:hypothetical protein